ncbi:MBL fold metallo-hydrolase [Methylobacterium variabile]|jgi:glyoxylase-like metal-dependent hydrolase (beta-lactamase superfamily II)|uniref:MBL fold metallo-hydrolase n=1 Tax=Methylobacterium variabile TaxID=298794 RepID=UPI0009FB3E06|nr:MBL fold metallo-hydrolase [Methylobacterium variabile]
MSDTSILNIEATNNNYAPVTVDVGSFKVTAIHDGHLDLPTWFLAQHENDCELNTEATFHLDVNAFLVRSSTHNLLIDAGAGGKMGPDVNRLVPNLAKIGLTPDDINFILCTHIHPDHTNGLINTDNTPIFNNAQIFVHQTEIDYWLTDKQYALAPADLRYVYDWAREAFTPYAGRTEAFTRGLILPGIEALPLFGHTPGHSGFQIDGGGNKQLIIWGDAVHRIAIQSRDPDISAQADVNQDDARASRRALFDRVATDDVLVTGMHMSFPGFGRLRRKGVGYDYFAEH